MAKDLRSQFKPTSVKSLKKVAEEDEKMLGISSNEYLQLEDKKTIKIRIFPAHPGVESFYVRRKCYWLPFQRNDGEMGRTSVNDSVIHGGTAMDLVDEYVKAAKKFIGGDSDKLEAITGRDGLMPNYSWICYADKVQPDTELKAKLWEFRKSVRDALNRLTFTEDDDEAIETDPFTDIDEGLPVMVGYNKTPNRKKGENYYDVAFAKKPVARPLTDAELEYFSNLKPLNEIIGKYTINDFDRALAGLQIFDEENEIGLFDDDDWLAKVEEIRAQYDSDDEDEDKKGKKKTAAKKTTKKSKSEDDDDEDDEDEKPAKKGKKSSKKVEDEDDDDSDDEDEEEEKPAKKSAKGKKKDEPEEDEEDEDEDEDDDSEDDSDSDEGDEFDDMERDELKKYIKKNGLDITVKKSMSDDDLRDAIRAAVKDSDSDDEDEDEDDDDEDDDEPKSKVSLDDIRKKLKGKK